MSIAPTAEQRALTRATCAGFAEGVTHCVGLAEKWLKPSHVRLHAGEMSAQEMRTVLAVVGAIILTMKGE